MQKDGMICTPTTPPSMLLAHGHARYQLGKGQSDGMNSGRRSFIMATDAGPVRANKSTADNHGHRKDC